MNLEKFWLSSSKYSAFKMCRLKFKNMYLTGKKGEFTGDSSTYSLNKFLLSSYLEYHQKNHGLFFKAPNFIKGLTNRLADNNLNKDEFESAKSLIEGYITEMEGRSLKLLEANKTLFYNDKEIKIVVKLDMYIESKTGKKSVVIFKTTNNYDIPENLYYDFEPQLIKFVVEDNPEIKPDYLEIFYLKFNQFIKLDFNKIDSSKVKEVILDMYSEIDKEYLNPTAGPYCDWCDYQTDCPEWKDDKYPEIPFKYRKDKTRYSFSRLSTYLQCPFKYKKLYLDKVPQLPQGFFSIGTTIHAVMESIYSKPQAPDLENLNRLYDKFWVPLGYSSPEEMKEYYDSGKQWLELYYNNFIRNQEWVKAIAVEKYFEIPIGNYFTIGFIDRIHPHKDGTVEVMDYKTNPEMKTTEEVSKDLQLTLYQYVLEKLGYKVSGLSLLFMRFGEKVSVLKNKDDLKTFEEFFIESVQKAESEKEYKPKINEYCKNCQFKPECPLFGKEPEQLKLV
ncbi:MAG: PD-(D/E)XK nuclease family protein [bacterium]|nr:PD-(D/E)XK nuclease family protein [bacterium]